MEKLNWSGVAGYIPDTDAYAVEIMMARDLGYIVDWHSCFGYFAYHPSDYNHCWSLDAFSWLI